MGCCYRTAICNAILFVEILAIVYLFSVSKTKDGARLEQNKETDHLPAAKPFAYYLLTESCIPPHLTSVGAFGNTSRCDVYVLSFKERCLAELKPDTNLKYYFHPDTTWSTGRNLLYKYGLNSGIIYQYHTFLDDDVQLFYTHNLDDYADEVGIDQFDRKIEFMDSFVSSKFGLAKAVRSWKKSPWRELEDTLLAESPAFAQVNLCERNGNQIRTFQSEKWRMVCPPSSKIPDITPVFFIDTLLISYHKDAAPLLLPFSTILDDVSWFISAMYQMFRAKALLYRQGIAIWSLSVVNLSHSDYPRGAPPKNYLEQYFASDGKDIENLMDPRQTNFVVFYDHGRWKSVFFADKGVCSSAVKFPVQEHYHVLPT